MEKVFILSGLEDPLLRVAVGMAERDKFLLIEGERGTGKTTIALHIFDALAEKPEIFDAANIYYSDFSKPFLLENIELSPTNIQNALLKILRRRKKYLFIATSTDIKNAYMKGKLQEDLYSKLLKNRVILTPLRERKKDIAVYAYKFLKELMDVTGKTVKGIDKDVLRVFESYHWPGNLKELRETIARMLISAKGESLCIEDLPEGIMEIYKNSRDTPPTFKELIKLELESQIKRFEMFEGVSYGIYDDILSIVEETMIKVALEKTNFVKTKAARFLGINRNTLSKKMKKYGLKAH